MKISVVTASFNSEATIGFTIESFLKQKHPDKEMLVVDGASRDGTLKIVEFFASPEIRVLSEPDKGVYDAMNKGFHRFTGDAVGFLNSDDTFHDDAVLSDIAAGLADADIVYGDIDMVTDHRTKRRTRVWHGGTFRRYSFQLGWVPPHPSFYMRREVAETVGDYDLQLHHHGRLRLHAARAGAATISASATCRACSSTSRSAASARAAPA